MESQASQLKKVAAKRLILVVLDGVYNCTYIYILHALSRCVDGRTHAFTKAGGSWQECDGWRRMGAR